MISKLDIDTHRLPGIMWPGASYGFLRELHLQNRNGDAVGPSVSSVPHLRVFGFNQQPIENIENIQKKIASVLNLYRCFSCYYSLKNIV